MQLVLIYGIGAYIAHMNVILVTELTCRRPWQPLSDTMGFARTSDGAQKVTVGKDTILVRPSVTRTSGDKFAWAITGPGLTSAHVAPERLAWHTRSSDGAVIVNLNTAPDVLLSGSTYTLTLAVQRGELIGSASVSLTVNMPPSSGFCEGMPRTGIQLAVRELVLWSGQAIYTT